MWQGEGWVRTRRQLGASMLVAAFVLEAWAHVGLPIALYGVIAGLLGLDILAGALAQIPSGTKNRDGK